MRVVLRVNSADISRWSRMCPEVYSHKVLLAFRFPESIDAAPPPPTRAVAVIGIDEGQCAGL